jgi:hypothetical protein
MAQSEYARRGPEGHFLPGADESVCANCSEPYPTELAQADALCGHCRPDPEAALRSIRHHRSLLDGSLLARLAAERAELEALGPALLAELQRLQGEGRRVVLVGASIIELPLDPSSSLE